MENEDFGFHDYDSAMGNGDILVLSGFKILPNAGGWNDQYETDTEDILTYLRGLAWARSLKGEDDGHQTATEDEDGFETGTTDNGLTKVADWQKAFVG